MHVWQADLVKDEIVEHVPEEGCDLLLIMFVLSAVNPKNMDLFMDHALKVFWTNSDIMNRDSKKVEFSCSETMDGMTWLKFVLNQQEKLNQIFMLDKMAH